MVKASRVTQGAMMYRPTLAMNELVFSARAERGDWQRLLTFASYKNSRSERPIEMYGFGAILRRLCHLPPRWPLMVNSQHGVSLWTVPIQHELNAPEPRLLVHSRRWVDIYSNVGYRRAVAIGSPFVMFRRHLLNEGQAQVMPTRRALFFLSHSTLWEKAQWQADHLLPALEQIRRREGDVTVCLHFVDVINGLAQSIFDAGFEVATAGHYFNTDFPHNFYTLLLGHDVVYTNAVGSHIFYAVEADKEVRWVDLPVHYVNIGYSDEVWKETMRERPIELAIAECVRAGAERLPDLKRICSEELGLQEMMKPATLLLLLLKANVEWSVMRQMKMLYWRLASRL